MRHSTINLSLTSEESLTDSKLPDTGHLRTKGQESVYETCACVIHTILHVRGVHVLREALVKYVFSTIGIHDSHRRTILLKIRIYPMAYWVNGLAPPTPTSCSDTNWWN